MKNDSYLCVLSNPQSKIERYLVQLHRKKTDHYDFQEP